MIFGIDRLHDFHFPTAHGPSTFGHCRGPARPRLTSPNDPKLFYVRGEAEWIGGGEGGGRDDDGNGKEGGGDTDRGF